MIRLPPNVKDGYFWRDHARKIIEEFFCPTCKINHIDIFCLHCLGRSVFKKQEKRNVIYICNHCSWRMVFRGTAYWVERPSKKTK